MPSTVNEGVGVVSDTLMYPTEAKVMLGLAGVPPGRCVTTGGVWIS